MQNHRKIKYWEQSLLYANNIYFLGDLLKMYN